jgi:hypothetical protein
MQTSLEKHTSCSMIKLTVKIHQYVLAGSCGTAKRSQQEYLKHTSNCNHQHHIPSISFGNEAKPSPSFRPYYPPLPTPSSHPYPSSTPSPPTARHTSTTPLTSSKFHSAMCPLLSPLMTTLSLSVGNSRQQQRLVCSFRIAADTSQGGDWAGR